MEIEVKSLVQGAIEAHGTVVIVDVFRCFTTAAVAFTLGAEKIVMVAEVEEALNLKERGVGSLCMGEVGGKKPEGFDLGNSPTELCTTQVQGLTLIQCTTAGTLGVSLAKHADDIYGGSLVVARATADMLLERMPDLVTVVAMGSEGRVRNDEDEQCALYLRNLLQGSQPDHDSVRDLVMAGSESRKYDDPNLPQYPASDREIALCIDSVPFALRIETEDGLLTARPESTLTAST